MKAAPYLRVQASSYAAWKGDTGEVRGCVSQYEKASLGSVATSLPGWREDYVFK